MITRKKILVVDDDRAINEAIQLILKDAGYGVLSTVDSTRVLKLVKKNPDLILLDIWMPKVDGRDVCRQLKTDNETKHIPVIMVSAARETKTIAREVGADDFLVKPFEMKALLQKISKFIH